MQGNKKVRIKDVARLAGVSEGTVDRVIHKRGEVSETSRIAVEKVMKDMRYVPNIIARSLASRKQYKFVCLIPSYQEGEYWHSVDQGIDKAMEDFMHYNVDIVRKYYDQYDQQSFCNAYTNILEMKPEAVFIAPIFRSETLRFTNLLTKLKIPFSFLDSVVEEAPFITYYGQHSMQSGYVAAKLLCTNLTSFSKILVVRTKRDGESFSNQTIGRYQGFTRYLTENNFQGSQIKIELVDGDHTNNRAVLTDTFNTHPDIQAAITFNSKVFRLADFLKSIAKKDVLLVGYDLLAENVNYLKEGIVSYLIAQRPEKQAYFSIRDMCNKLIFDRKNEKMNFVPIDILIKENIDYYLNFRD